METDEYGIISLPTDDDTDGLISYMSLYGVEMLSTNSTRFNRITKLMVEDEKVSDEQLERFYINCLSKIPTYKIVFFLKNLALNPNTNSTTLRYLLGKIRSEEETYSGIILESYALIFSDIKDFIHEHPNIVIYKNQQFDSLGIKITDLDPEWSEMIMDNQDLELVLGNIT